MSNGESKQAGVSVVAVSSQQAEASEAAAIFAANAPREASSSAEGYMLMPHSYNVVLPDTDDFYLVREDQLEIVRTGGKDHSLEFALAFGGGCLGFFQNVLHVFDAIYTKKPVEPSDFWCSVIFVVLVIASALKLLEWKKVKKSSDAVVERIKSGQKAPVGNARQ